MDQRLKNAAKEGDINVLYTLLAEDPYLLQRIDQIPIVDTPLHIAASAGQTHFVMEIANLKPSLARKLNHIGLSPMHLALQKRHIQTVRGLIRFDEELIRVKGREMFTPLHLAAEMDDVDLLAEFLSFCPSSIEDLTIRLETAVHIAVNKNRRRALEVMLRWLQRVNREEVLNWKDEDGNTALHIATSINESESVNLLLKTCTKHERLEKAAKEGNINELYTLLAEDPNLLERIDKKPIVDTPVHIAASVGQTHFVKEIANLKPSLARKLNHIGLSPMHLALQNGHNQTVRELVRVDSELIRVRGREMITPLHLAAEMDDVDLLAEFLSSCPSSMEDLTIRLETAVHIAVKNNSLRAFKVMFGWLRRVNMEKVLNWKDEEGNTVLHIATSTNEPEVMRSLILNEVNINAKNSSGLTAMDIFLQGQGQSDQNRNVGDILRRANAKSGSSLPELTTSPAKNLSRELSREEKLSKYLGLEKDQKKRKSGRDVSEAILVVAILIVTATYQAAQTPPGGYWQDDSNSPPNTTTIIYSPVNISTASLYTPPANITTTSLCGNQSEPHHAGGMIMASSDASYFYTLNAVAFYTSICSIMTLTLGLPGAHIFLPLSIYSLNISYYYSMVINFRWEVEEINVVTIILVFLRYSIIFLSFLIPLYFYIYKAMKRRVVTLRQDMGIEGIYEDSTSKFIL